MWAWTRVVEEMSGIVLVYVEFDVWGFVVDGNRVCSAWTAAMLQDWKVIDEGSNDGAEDGCALV